MAEACCGPSVSELLIAHGVAKASRLRPGDVIALFRLLESWAQEHSGSVGDFYISGAAAWLHIRRPERIIDAIAELEAVGIIRDGILSLPSRVSHESASGRRRPQTGAERMAAYRARQRGSPVNSAAQPTIVAAGDDEPSTLVTPSQPPLSLSLFPIEDQEVGKERKPRARAPDPVDEFDALRSTWPKQEAIEEARRAYVMARKKGSSGEIAHGAERYIATKPDWQECMQLGRWLRAQRWKDHPLLPFEGKPHLVTEAIPQEPLDEPNERLRQRLGDGEYRRWFRHVTPIEHADDRLRLGVGSPFVRNYLREHFEPDILLAWQVREVDIVVTNPERRTG